MSTTETTINDLSGRPIRAIFTRPTDDTERWSFLLGDDRRAEGSRIVCEVTVSGTHATRTDADGVDLLGIVPTADALRWAAEQVWTERERVLAQAGPARATAALGVALI